MLLWIGLGVFYFILLVTLGITTFRKGHWVMGIFGFIFPLFWLIGAMMEPREQAAGSDTSAGSSTY